MLVVAATFNTLSGSDSPRRRGCRDVGVGGLAAILGPELRRRDRQNESTSPVAEALSRAEETEWKTMTVGVDEDRRLPQLLP